MAEIYGYNVIDPLSVMLTHLAETIKKYAYEMLGRSEVLQLVENLKRASPDLVEEVVPNIVSYSVLEKVLRNLLKEGVPIKDLGTILETLADALTQGRDVDTATEQVRGRCPEPLPGASARTDSFAWSPWTPRWKSVLSPP